MPDEQKMLDSGDSLLADRIARWTAGQERFDTPIAGLSLHHWRHKTEPESYMLPPSICLIGQGRKRLLLGEEEFCYDKHQFLITSVDLPVMTHITEASEEAPYLGLTMEMNTRVITQMLVEQKMADSRVGKGQPGVAVSQITPSLLAAFIRLLDLLEEPENLAGLAPLIQQEIYYRLLVGEQGPWLRQIVSAGHHGYRMSRAIEWLKSNFKKPVKVEELAEKAGLSLSAFHSHFRSTTAMSPLQFQKRMRLNEARRLMLTEHLDASSAAFEVGYESPSQFSREYSRLFGAPPKRDISRLSQASSG
ncbi:AraC family transcriptional regulator [Neptuniibacter halophilus]|uniref:AraC family transcriptional regulator n=1 Tax=Neptuniibacter halophilus TaxID=651666 RepID=UPI0025745247|nr:AraC family transcriptional regulator [Neptuniibacter halophilus]